MNVPVLILTWYRLMYRSLQIACKAAQVQRVQRPKRFLITQGFTSHGWRTLFKCNRRLILPMKDFYKGVCTDVEVVHLERWLTASCEFRQSACHGQRPAGSCWRAPLPNQRRCAPIGSCEDLHRLSQGLENCQSQRELSSTSLPREAPYWQPSAIENQRKDHDHH